MTKKRIRNPLSKSSLSAPIRETRSPRPEGKISLFCTRSCRVIRTHAASKRQERELTSARSREEKDLVPDGHRDRNDNEEDGTREKEEGADKSPHC